MRPFHDLRIQFKKLKHVQGTIQIFSMVMSEST